MLLSLLSVICYLLSLPSSTPGLCPDLIIVFESLIFMILTSLFPLTHCATRTGAGYLAMSVYWLE